MTRIAMTSSLSSYQQIRVSDYRNQLRQGDAISVELSYQYRDQPYSYSIELSKTPCHFGGQRFWFRCPSCSKRVAILYCAGLYVCRLCIGANYSSQLESKTDRIYSKLNAIRARLGWQRGIINGVGLKPRYLHHSTYQRLVNEYELLTAELIRTFKR